MRLLPILHSLENHAEIACVRAGAQLRRDLDGALTALENVAKRADGKWSEEDYNETSTIEGAAGGPPEAYWVSKVRTLTHSPLLHLSVES